jgi:hypothetical protein
MQNLLETNIYEPQGKVLICGTCLPVVQSEGYKKIANNCDVVLTLCLEREHINMAITKICSMLSTGNITELVFASVNKSPHCIQLHYIKREVRRMMDKSQLPPIFSFVVEDNQLNYIPDDVIDASKNLVDLAKIVESKKAIKVFCQND